MNLDDRLNYVINVALCVNAMWNRQTYQIHGCRYLFTAFFVFEVLRGLGVHTMQYLLVGLSMAMFFLLIISLSEHIPFPVAYAISGSACVLLIGFYLAGVLGSRRPALMFSGGIALLFGVLYGVLQSEDNALLMGALILFAALAVVMMLTRRMDWYRLHEASNTI